MITAVFYLDDDHVIANDAVDVEFFCSEDCVLDAEDDLYRERGFLRREPYDPAYFKGEPGGGACYTCGTTAETALARG